MEVKQRVQTFSSWITAHDTLCLQVNDGLCRPLYGFDADGFQRVNVCGNCAPHEA